MMTMFVGVTPTHGSTPVHYIGMPSVNNFGSHLQQSSFTTPASDVALVAAISAANNVYSSYRASHAELNYSHCRAMLREQEREDVLKLQQQFLFAANN